MADVRVDAVLDEGLGNQAYLVDLGDGRALALDPTVDLRSLDALAARRGLSVAYVAETHLHADFLSGAVRLSRRDGAQAIGSTAGARRFDHMGLADGEDVDLGGLTLRGWATPGHTDEHMSYLLLDADRPVAVFTGGSLIVGAAARTDLMGATMTEPLARAQFRSLCRLAGLPPDTLVYPTHGAGSFCSALPGADRTSTIGREKATNPLMRLADEDAFVEALLDSLGTYPPYFVRLAELNRAGVEDPGPAVLTPLSISEVRALRRGGAEIVDVRPTDDYAAGHVRGSVAIPLRGVFATWLGWLLPEPTIPVVVIRNPDQDPDEIIWQARKVGYRVAGELVDGVAAWAAHGGSVRTTGLLDPADVDPSSVVDVRQRAEFVTGHLPGAINVELGALTDLAATSLPEGPLVAMCGHGERAASGASMLERAGRTDVAVLSGGPEGWAAATGRAIQDSA